MNGKEKNNLSDYVLYDINLLLQGKYDTSQAIKLRDNTPKQFIQLGIKNLPMLMNSNHVLENILTEREAKSMILYNKDGHYHGLGVKKFLEVINSLDYPEKIFKHKNNKDYIVLTNQFDYLNLKVIVPVFIETKGNYNYMNIETNKIKTIYGKSKLNDYLKKNLRDGNLSIVFDNKKRTKTTGIQSSNGISSLNGSNIPQNMASVNAITNYSMQKVDDNAKLDQEELKNIHGGFHSRNILVNCFYFVYNFSRRIWL